MGFAYLDLLAARFRDEPRANPDADRPAAVVLGDSVMERVSDSDTDRTALGGMIRKRMPVRSLVLSAPAYSPVHFADYARVFEALPTRPRLVIAPVNVRFLSPQWDVVPRYRWLNHRDAIRRFLEDPDGAVPELGPDINDTTGAALRAEVRALSVSSPITGDTTVGALEDIRDAVPRTEEGRRARVRQIVAYHYGLPFVSDHPGLVAIGDMVRILRSCGVRVLLYATPVNVDFAELLGGAEIGRVIADKVAAARDAVLAAAGDHQGATFLDLHRSCRADHFLHRAYMVEHMDQHGRAALADAITERAAAMLRED